ncbi:glycosyltransferase [Neobacillus vireti]|uniref:Capsular polysaccharide biosynthsis protein n=1 Tax=Neobacillus vireti LMG 21834 TaxID=1131730 RepID=A0AB94IKN3_9BACI|nr:glycosyltransferase [Neobacillus vireti]ETI67553.1 capsular polysaccharide biosynthsis protein [Neobacillus vireti LMG 21834]KLT18495.1 capsular biosynthesis protein [Neobacillus vireti]
MKKNLLFVIDSLVGAGAEKSLITLLSLLDYEKYSVDLMLFAHGEILQELVPKEVKILRPLKYTNFSRLNLTKAILYSLKKTDFKMLNSRLKYSLKIRMKKYSNPQKARLYWEDVSSVIEGNTKKYDIAISYAQGVPTFYVAEKVKAKEKFAWVNVTYRLDYKEATFQKQFYDQFNKIIAVSDSTKEIFLETFPSYDHKIEIIYDINDPRFISNMAELGENYTDHFDGVRILTIGRLAHQKGYDIALHACKRLKEKGIKFKWYVLGKGPLLGEIQDFINENNLSDYFVLLGVTANPYPIIKNCDIYVQTSRFEGFGLAIAEARMLNIPVVTTRFDAVYNQMVDGKNGLVVDMNANAICEGILKLIHNKDLRESIVTYLQHEKKGNLEELDKFYELIG